MSEEQRRELFWQKWEAEQRLQQLAYNVIHESEERVRNMEASELDDEEAA